MLKVKHISLAAASAVVLCAGSAGAQTTGAYLTDSRGEVAKNAFDMCWRTPAWTPAAANAVCDPDLVPKPAPVARAEPPPAPPPPVLAEPVAPPPPPPAPVAAIAPTPAPVSEKVTLETDVLFDFDKATLKAEGKQALDDLVAKMGPMSLEVVVAVGYTDTIGAAKYNQEL